MSDRTYVLALDRRTRGGYFEGGVFGLQVLHRKLIERRKRTTETDLGNSDTETGGVGEGDSPHPNPIPLGEGEVEGLRAQLEEARARGLEAYRRALLAENAGSIVPELVAGATVEELDRSVEVARTAFGVAKQAAMKEFSATQIPTGNPIRQGPGVEGMSPLEKIAYGLKRD